MPVLVPLDEHVTQGDEHGAVPLEGGRQPQPEIGPEALAVQGGGHPVEQQRGAPGLPGDLAGQRLDRGLVEHRLDPRDGCRHGLPVRERAGGPAQAVGDERPERDLESLRLDAVHVQRGLGRIHGSIQDQGPHVRREQLGVPGAQVGAVGLAEVGELGVAERGAQHVHVPGGVGRADIRQQGTGSLLAAPREQLAF